MTSMMTAKHVLDLYTSMNIKLDEGGSCEAQIQYFLTFLRNHPNVKTVFEIGFNGGLSSLGFLSAREDIQVVSVDIGAHAYVLKAKEWIDKKFPGRHTLIIGDSTTAVPTLKKLFPSFHPDLIFIDGGHDEPVPRLDLEHCLQLARPDTWFILDDAVPWMKDILQPVNKLIQDHRIHIYEHKVVEPIHGWLLFRPVGLPTV